MNSFEVLNSVKNDDCFEYFQEGKHIFDFNNALLLDINSSILSEPPLEQGSIISKELPRIIDSYDLNLHRILRQKERILLKAGFRFNLMVVGQVGVGKKTLINSLFDAEIMGNSGDGTFDANEKEHTTSIKCTKAEINFGSSKLKLNITTTPGYGQYLDNSYAWTSLAHYVDEQMRSYIFQEEQPYREQIKDNRIHCCLYLISPSNRGLTYLDVITLKELSKRTNLIPIIAKADALNPIELEIFKIKVRQTFKDNNIIICRYLDPENCPVGDISSICPLDVISSNNKEVNDHGEYIRCRKYHWGVIDIENPSVSKIGYLRKILFDTCFSEFITGTESYYELYRRYFLSERISKARQYFDTCDYTLPAVTEDTLEVLQELNFDDMDQNKLLNYCPYQIFDKQFVDAITMKNNPSFLQSLFKLKKRMEIAIKRMELKYKEKNEYTFNMQLAHNQEIENMTCEIEKLQLQCSELENQLVIDREHSNLHKEARRVFW